MDIESNSTAAQSPDEHGPPASMPATSPSTPAVSLSPPAASPALQPKVARLQRGAGHAPRQRAPRRPAPRRRLIWLTATLAVLLLLGGGCWAVSRNLSSIAAALLRQRVDDSLDGRLEFSSLDVDFTGRAVLRDVAVYPTGQDAPVLTCPRVTVSLDLINFLGPNRGQRAVAVTLHQPRAVVVREADGAFNLAKLAKPPKHEREAIGVDVHLSDARVQFTDLCLLDQGYPRIPLQGGIAGRLLSELGYSPQGPSEAVVHTEELSVSGTVAYNPSREELGVNARLTRGAGGGRIGAVAKVSGKGAEYNVVLTPDAVDLQSLSDYARALFPNLRVAAPEAQPKAAGSLRAQAADQPVPAAGPSLAGMIDHARIELAKRPGQDIRVSAQGSLEGLSVDCQALPPLQFKRLSGEYAGDTKRLAADFAVGLPGGELSGKPRLNLAQGQGALSGNLVFSAADLPKLLAELATPSRGRGPLPLTGSVRAEATLGGTTQAPQCTASLSSARLAYGKLDLGKLGGTLKLDSGKLSAEGVKLSGGKVPAALRGALSFPALDGDFALSAGPLSVEQALDIASRLGVSGVLSKLDAMGDLSLAAEGTVRRGTLATALSLRSSKLVVAKQTLTGLTARGSVSPTGVRIEEAEAVLTTPQAVNLGPFSSKGPLNMAARAGGTVSFARGGGGGTLALTGKAETLNLAPAQARISFKAAGALSDPEVKLQAKTTQAEEPLAVQITGHYRKGWSPITASLSWHETKADFAGKVDLANKLVDGKLTAAAVDLARFSSDKRLSGVLSAEAVLGGSFDKPTVSGKLDSPRLAYAFPQRTYQVANLSAGFKLREGDTVSVSGGRFSFEGNAFTADGVLGAQSKEITLSCASFNLFSALALMPSATKPGNKSAPSHPALAIKSAGPLSVRLSGELADPRADIQYTSSAGSVEGHPFDSTALTAAATLDGLNVSQFEVRSPEGRITASGTLTFTRPQAGKPAAPATPPKRPAGIAALFGLRRASAVSTPAAPPAAWGVASYKAQATFDGFDVGVLTPLAPTPLLSKLEGRLNGTLSLAGTPKDYSAEGKLSLDKGKFQDIAITEATAELAKAPGGIAVRNARITAEGTSLTMSGTLGKSLADTQLTAQAPSVELALLKPFLPSSVPSLKGTVSLDLALSPSKGAYPAVQLQLKDTGHGVQVDKVQFDSASLEAAVSGDRLTVTRCDLSRQGSAVSLGGKLDLAALRKGQGGKGAALDWWAKSGGLTLADIAALLPGDVQDKLPEGKVSGDLTLAGTTAKPLASGTLAFSLSSLPASLPLKVSRIDGEVGLAKNDFDIRHVVVSMPEGGGLSQAEVTGSGKLSLNPPGLVSGSIDIALAPQGQYTAVDIPGVFTGTLGGLVTVRGGQDLTPVVGGQLVVTGPGTVSKAQLKLSQENQPEAAGVRLDKLHVRLQPGTEVAYKPVDLQVSLQGDLSLSGVWGKFSGPDALSVLGDLSVSKGSMRLYRHVIRLENQANRLSFAGDPGDLFPYFTGVGALILPGVLTGNEVASAGAPGESTLVKAGGDLKVYFNFNRVKLDPSSGALDKITLSSEPPLSKEQIMGLLLGGVGELVAGQEGLSQVAQSEALGYGMSFISRAIERQFDLEQFNLGGSGSAENPFYVEMEKAVSPDVSLTYFRNFFTQTGQQEEFGVKYNLFKQQQGNRYQNVDLKLNFQQGGRGRSGSEFMFVWTTRF